MPGSIRKQEHGFGELPFRLLQSQYFTGFPYQTASIFSFIKPMDNISNENREGHPQGPVGVINIECSHENTDIFLLHCHD